MKAYIKPILITLILLALLSFAYWYSEQQYQAGYDAAEAKYQKAINEASQEFANKKAKLLNEHLKEMEKVSYVHSETIKKLREASDTCLDATVPPVIVERLQRERATVDRLSD